MQTKIVVLKTYPVQPEQVDHQGLYGFGNAVSDNMVGWLVLFCQMRKKGWQPFTLAELERFCSEQRMGSSVTLVSLLEDSFLVFAKDRLYFTHRFVATAFLHAPYVR